MGTIQSSEHGSSSNMDSPFDFMNRICFCEGHVEETSTTTHVNPLEASLQRLHNTQGPYLGTLGQESSDSNPTTRTKHDIQHPSTPTQNDWDSDENDCILDQSNMLDITKDDDLSQPPLTPQRIDSSFCTTQHFDQHHIDVLSSSYIHHSPSNLSDDDGGWSASTGRTYTSGSTDATDQKYNPNHIGNLYHSKSRDISISFTPRRLFRKEDSFSLEQTTKRTTPDDKTNATSTNISSSHSKSIIVHNGVFKSQEYSDCSQGPVFINTLPSFIQGQPIRLKVRQSYDDHSFSQIHDTDHTDEAVDTSDMNNMSLLSDAEHAHLFSYDPSFTAGEYCITTLDDGDYGNGLCVKMGAQYMTLQDKDGRVWGIIRSRNTFIPSAIIYSPKERYPGQIPTSHRPSGNEADSVELYPWALVKKHGRRLEHDVSIHMVADPTSIAGCDSTFTANGTTTSHRNNEENDLLGGLFETIPTFWSRHGFDNRHNQVHIDTHTHSVIFHVETNDDGSLEEVPCCMSVRDMESSTSTFQVTIAPGIDPLIVICYMAAHSKMDVEPNLVGL